VNRAVLTVACLFLLGASTTFADDTLWTRRYNGTGDRNDAARVALVDASGGVIVVGSTVGSTTGLDISVVKYNSAGFQLWTATIAGSGTSHDEAAGAALDRTGAIHVTGTTGTYPNYDILTVKLNADGSEAWRRTYDGAASRADEPAAIAVDSAGLTYVTGYTNNASDVADFVTIKYSAGTGLPLWTVVRPGEGGGTDKATAIALGPDGSVWVTGYSARQYMDDYCTVKYSSTGVEDTVAFYNYSANATDQAVAIAVDAAGNAYVTGQSANAPAPNGKYEYATIKYNSSGAQQWVARYTGTGGSNMPAALALGTSAVYVTGSSQRAAGDMDYATVAYNTNTGDTLWVRRFNAPPGGNDDATAIAVGPADKVFVTGTSIDWNGRGDYMTLRYSAAGEAEWSERYNSPFDNDDEGVSIALDSRSDAIVLGTSYGSANYDFLTVKYDSSATGGIVNFEQAAPGRPGLRLAPNPARAWVRVEHSLSGAGPAVITLLGADGRVVRAQRFDRLADRPARLDLTGLGPGVYIVRLVAGGRSATQKLVVGQ